MDRMLERRFLVILSKIVKIEVTLLNIFFYVDFLGRVKAKTSDVEKILKDKDKHGILAKVKEGAENIQTKVQAKVESVVKNMGEHNKGSQIYN